MFGTWFASELESTFPGAIGNCLDTTMIKISATVENAGGQTEVSSFARQGCANKLAFFSFVYLLSFDILLTGSCSRKCYAVFIIDELSIDIRVAPEDTETGLFSCSGYFPADRKTYTFPSG